MFASVADTLRDLGSLAAALAAIAALFALISRLPPLRWIFRHLVTEPFGQWFRLQVREELERRNGGSSVMDRLVTLEDALLDDEGGA